jgi:hypothetical protein
VLPVGVEGREHLGAGLAAGVLDTGLDRRALAQVDRMRAMSPVLSLLPSSTRTTWSKADRMSATTSPITLASLKAGTTIQTSW